MLRAEVARDDARVLDLREALLLESDGVGAHRLRAERCHHSHDRAGIEASAQEGADRHVAQEPPPDRGAEEILQVLLGLRLGLALAVRAEGELPVGLGHDAVSLEPEEMAREELEHVAQDRLGRRDVRVRKVPVDGRGVHVALDRGVGQERLHLRGEGEPARPVVVEERLLPQAVARHEERLAILVPEREGEHAVQPPERVRSPDAVGAEDHLGVGARAEGLPQPLQLGLHLGIVVDLPVEDDLEPPVLEGHGLVAAGR